MKARRVAAGNYVTRALTQCREFLNCTMFRSTVHDKEFEINPVENGFEVNGTLIRPDTISVGPAYFHILLNGKGYRAEIVKADTAAKRFDVKVNGRIYPVVVKDKFDLLLEQMGMSATVSSRFNSVKAPMPGLIIDLKVKDGDEVKAGDALLILEAMKMENIIKSPGDGVVRKVCIKKGDSVEKNQVLIEF